MLAPLQIQINQRIETLLNTSTRQILGIVGAPGAGKSTIASQIAAQFGDAVVVVPMDGFHLSNQQLTRLNRMQRKGAPDTFDVAGYVSLLMRIRQQSADETVYAPIFERSIEEAIASGIAVQSSTQLVITEGNYLLLESGGWQHVRPLLDACWYVDVEPGVRLSRLIERHIQFGRTRERAQAWVETTDEPNARLIELTKSRADWILSS